MIWDTVCVCVFIWYVKRIMKVKEKAPTECNLQYKAASKKDRFVGAHHISNFFVFDELLIYIFVIFLNFIFFKYFSIFFAIIFTYFCFAQNKF